LGEGERRRLLRDVRVVGVRVDAKLAAKDLPTERRLWEHPIYGLFNDPFRMLRDHGSVRREKLVSHVACVTEVPLLLRFTTRDLNLRRIDDDDVVTRVHVGREGRLVFAADDLRDLG